MSKTQKQEKSLQELLCEVIPSLAKMPADLLGSKTKVGAALSAFSSALGKITNLKQFSDRLEKDLQRELNTKKILKQIFNDAGLINQSLQGQVVKSLLVDEEIWKAIERHKSSLLQVLEKKCYKGLDQVLKDIIESPSVITSKTALTLATAISQNPKAPEVIEQLFKEGSGGIMLYLKDSAIIKSQLDLQGIKDENRMLLFATIIPLIQIPLPHLKEFINFVNVALEQEVKAEAVIDAIEKLVPMLRNPDILILLNFERVKPLIEDLSVTYKTKIDSAIRTIPGAPQEISAELINNFASTAFGVLQSVVSPPDKMELLIDMAKSFNSLTQAKDEKEKRKLMADVITKFIEGLEKGSDFAKIYDQQLVSFLQKNKDVIASIIESKAQMEGKPTIKVNGKRIVDIISKSQNLQGMLKLAHYYLADGKLNKLNLIKALPKTLWHEPQILREVMSITIAMVKSYIKQKLPMAKAQSFVQQVKSKLKSFNNNKSR